MNGKFGTNQKNPFEDLFWQNRGYPQKPRNWEQLLEDMGYMDEESDQSSSNSESSEYGSDSDDSDFEEQSQDKQTNNNQYQHVKAWPQHPNSFRGTMEWRQT